MIQKSEPDGEKWARFRLNAPNDEYLLGDTPVLEGDEFLVRAEGQYGRKVYAKAVGTSCRMRIEVQVDGMCLRVIPSELQHEATLLTDRDEPSLTGGEADEPTHPPTGLYPMNEDCTIMVAVPVGSPRVTPVRLERGRVVYGVTMETRMVEVSAKDLLAFLRSQPSTRDDK